MRFLQFKTLFKDFTVFSLTDILMTDNSFNRRRLNEWQDKGYIKKLIRGRYTFSDVNFSENVLFEIANRIYAPSYISFETAMAFYGLIPETVLKILSASTKKTTRFHTTIGHFLYRTILPNAFFGYTIISYEHGTFKIAEIEKAIVDYLYLHADETSDEDFSSLRINQDIFHSKVDRKKLKLFVKRVGKKALADRVDRLARYLNNA